MKYNSRLSNNFVAWMVLIFHSFALAEVGDKEPSIEDMYDAAIFFGIIFAIIVFFVKKRSRRASWIVFSIYASLVLIWEAMDISANSDIRGAIMEELGDTYYWHQAASVFLAVFLAGIPFLFNKSGRHLR